jgi:hypothetical protein
MTARNHWIGVVSRAHARLGVEGSFIQLNHGQKAPLQRFHAGDGLLIYSPKTAYPDGETLQAFTAIGIVRSGEIYQVEMSPDFKPYRMDVGFLPCEEVPIRRTGGRPFASDCSRFRLPTSSLSQRLCAAACSRKMSSRVERYATQRGPQYGRDTT